MKVQVNISDCVWACDGVVFEDHPHPDEFDMQLDIDPFLDDLESEAIIWQYLQDRGVCLLDGTITVEGVPS